MIKFEQGKDTDRRRNQKGGREQSHPVVRESGVDRAIEEPEGKRLGERADRPGPGFFFLRGAEWESDKKNQKESVADERRHRLLARKAHALPGELGEARANQGGEGQPIGSPKDSGGK